MHRDSLFKVLRKRDGKLLEPKLQRSIATSVARGMAHLHSRSPPILHLVPSVLYQSVAEMFSVSNQLLKILSRAGVSIECALLQ